jgi:hypothetical protein
MCWKSIFAAEKRDGVYIKINVKKGESNEC